MKLLTKPPGNGLRLSGARQQTLDAKSSIDAPPAVARQIKYREQIAREQWGGDGLYLASVTPGLQMQRQEDAISLVGQLSDREPLTLWQSPDYIPALFAC